MRWYEIPKGTVGKLITQKPPHWSGDGILLAKCRNEIKDWVTRKDLAFGDTILDPVRLYNRRDEFDCSNPLVKLVQQDYALFSSLGSELDTILDPVRPYILAIPYNKVKVS